MNIFQWKQYIFYNSGVFCDFVDVEITDDSVYAVENK